MYIYPFIIVANYLMLGSERLNSSTAGSISFRNYPTHSITNDLVLLDYRAYFNNFLLKFSSLYISYKDKLVQNS